MEQNNLRRSCCRAVRSLRRREGGAGSLLQVGCAFLGCLGGGAAGEVISKALRWRVGGKLCRGCRGVGPGSAAWSSILCDLL